MLQIQKSVRLKLKMEPRKKFSQEVCPYARSRRATISFTPLYLYSPNQSLAATFKSAPPLCCHSATISPESSTYFHHLDQETAHHQPIIPSGGFLNMRLLLPSLSPLQETPLYTGIHPVNSLDDAFPAFPEIFH